MAENTKYKLVRAGRMLIHRTDEKKRFYRIQALRDIPQHGVKEGDWGGYVTNKDALNETGNAWIGGKAQVIGRVAVSGDALIGDVAVVRTRPNTVIPFTINQNVRILGRATVNVDNPTGRSLITDDVEIYDDAQVMHIYNISGTTKIYGNAVVKLASSVSNCKIFDNAKVGAKADLSQVSVSDNSEIAESVEIKYSVISGDSFVGNHNKFFNMVIKDERIEPKTHGHVPEIKYIAPSAEDVIKLKEEKDQKEAKKKPAIEAKEPVVVRNPMVIAYEQVCEKIASYETDIVKIIKYPVMADKTDPLTLDMVMSLNSAELFSSEPDSNEFKEAVIALQKAFIMAESNARKIASSLLSETEKKKTAKATDLFRVATNEASSEQEKKVAFIQGFKQLEGILDVPESAVDAFRIKIGLPELEM